MKVGIFTELYLPSVGGQEIRYKELALTLAARGHSISVFCIGHEVNLPNSSVEDGVSVFRKPIDPYYKMQSAKWLRRSPLTILHYAMWARKIALTKEFDFCLYNEFPFLHIALAPRKVRKVAMLDWCEIRSGFPYTFLQKILPWFCKYNAGVSIGVQKHIAGVSGREVLHLPSGINVASYRYRPPDERSGILYLGRIAKHKNLSLLIEAFHILRNNGYTGKLRIAGDGPYMAEVISQCRASNSVDYIELLGAVSDEKKIQLLADAEVFAMPSQREGLPRVVAEAMASGTPTVTANFPENGTCAVVRQYGCGVVTQGNARAFAEGLDEARNNWLQLSEMGRQAAIGLDWSKLVRDIENYMGESHRF